GSGVYTVLTGVIAIGTYGNHNLALKGDGSVWAWGDNSSGQLGDGGTAPRSGPVKVNGLPGYVITLAAGQNHSLAVLASNTVWTWGANGSGQLGDGSTVRRTTPVQAVGLANVIGVAGGMAHSLAMKTDGTVWAWGDNLYGELGDGSNTERHTPVQVSGLTGVKALAAGDFHSLALKNDGSVWAWGWNFDGQLGDGTNM